MTGYLKLDSTRVSFGEYWRWKPGPEFIILALHKLLGMRLPSNLLVPAVATVDPVDPATQSPALVSALGAPVAACRQKGYALELWYANRALGPIVGLGAALLSDDGLAVALALAAQTKDGLKREVHLALVSRLRNGRMLGTTDSASLFRPPPRMESLRLPGRPPAQLLDVHARRVSARRAEVIPSGDVRGLIRELEQMQVDVNLARGIYVPATPDDIARATPGRATGPEG